MHRSLRAGLALVAAFACTACDPSVIEIAKKTSLVEASGAIRYDGREFPSSFTEPCLFEGSARLKVRTYREDFPFFTHDVMVASGDFADPDKVKVSARGGGNYVWRARTKPEGSAVFLHLIPGSAAVAGKLDRLEEGKQVRIEGKAEKSSTVKDDRGGWIKLGHDNHKFVIALEVR